MDANTPINIPIRLEQWIHDNYVNDRNDEHCGLSLSGSASERL